MRSYSNFVTFEVVDMFKGTTKELNFEVILIINNFPDFLIGHFVNIIKEHNLKFIHFSLHSDFIEEHN